MEQVVELLAERGIRYSGRAAVGKWETGSVPRHETVAALADIYGVSATYLYESAMHHEQDNKAS